MDAGAVAIIGGGFSGSLMALHLLRRLPAATRVLLIERSPSFGRGVAYGACHERHLLNVRVANMSVWPDQPGHLEGWLEHRFGERATPASFITRRVYGDYVSSLLEAAGGSRDGGRLILMHDEAVGLANASDGFRVGLDSGRTAVARAVVLALGARPGRSRHGLLDRLPDTLLAPDPWARDALDELDPANGVVLLGTGLTMADVALALKSRGHRGPLLAISRRGLEPRTHAGAAAQFSARLPAANVKLSALVREVRARAGTAGWRHAVDELRPVTQALWRSADLTTRRRFMRHLRPWWDAHRHRMAPDAAAEIEAMRNSGQLRIAAGRIVSARAQGANVRLTWRRRGARDAETLVAGRIVDCAGWASDFGTSVDPLVRHLLGTARARTDPLGLGFDVDAECRMIGPGGGADERLWAVGPLTRGAFWEVVAVPDIRAQVADVAARIAGRLGEGGGWSGRKEDHTALM